jgi:hypothetical protein
MNLYPSRCCVVLSGCLPPTNGGRDGRSPPAHRIYPGASLLRLLACRRGNLGTAPTTSPSCAASVVVTAEHTAAPCRRRVHARRARALALTRRGPARSRSSAGLLSEAPSGVPGAAARAAQRRERTAWRRTWTTCAVRRPRRRGSVRRRASATQYSLWLRSPRRGNAPLLQHMRAHAARRGADARNAARDSHERVAASIVGRRRRRRSWRRSGAAAARRDAVRTRALQEACRRRHTLMHRSCALLRALSCAPGRAHRRQCVVDAARRRRRRGSGGSGRTRRCRGGILAAARRRSAAAAAAAGPRAALCVRASRRVPTALAAGTTMARRARAGAHCAPPLRRSSARRACAQLSCPAVPFSARACTCAASARPHTFMPRLRARRARMAWRIPTRPSRRLTTCAPTRKRIARSRPRPHNASHSVGAH